jgi:hypothetical protein
MVKLLLLSFAILLPAGFFPPGTARSQPYSLTLLGSPPIFAALLNAKKSGRNTV